MNTMLSQKFSCVKKVKKYRVLEAPVSSVIIILSVGIGLLLLALSVIGLFVGALKEAFYFISSSQGFSTKTTPANPDPVNVLITQD